MDLRVLGPLEVERDGEVLGLGGRKQRSVLAVLVLHAREVIGGARLADAIWDGRPPASAQTTLRGYVSNLRKVLEPDRGADDAPQILRTTPAGYVLDVRDEQIDARRFERLVTSGRHRREAGSTAGAVGEWTRALEMWRGEAFQDFAYSEFVQPEAVRLEERRLACVEDLLDAQIELGRHDVVVGDLEAFCSFHPTRERALRLWMLALYRCGRQSDAIAAYEDGRRRLADEIGVDPSPELRSLHELIVRQDESLSPASVDPSPAGKQTLTFLLGDVERSTQKLRTLGDAYAGVLEEHRRLLLDAFGAHGGRAVRTWGDGVFAAFDVATDAVRAAVATQLALCGAGFSEDRMLPVRLGVHTGEATMADGEFVGLAIHLADRIMDAAHGGQILVSQATKDLCEAEEGTATTFLDTGAHSLKDFPDRVRLFQVAHPELRHDFPPLRTRSGRTDNLPNRLKSFVGRERDLEQIEETLAEARVVTLTGVGGVGKTTLAVEAGRCLVSEYQDGVWLCELASVDDSDTIVHEVASTIGVEQQPGRSMRETLLTALRQRESLMILDNCEHLLAPVAELVEDIVQKSRTTDVLVTSREALGAEGERTWPVRSLPVRADAESEGGAVRLFEDRARDVRPDFRINERVARDVENICSRLDGIPLAIELAAARVTSMAPAQIAKRLEEDFRFLRSGRRGAIDRHRTLHGAIAWQYDVLSEAERSLFDRLSVFAGGFTLEAAEDVCGRGLDLDVADGLASLVAKSMVEADVTGAEARYSLLETMRQYGQDRLAERGEAQEIVRAHARYFAQLLERLFEGMSTQSEELMPQLAVELDNLRAAQAWAKEAGDIDLAMRIATHPPMWSQLQYPEMFGWAEDAIAMPGANDHERLATAMLIALLGRGGRNAPSDAELAARLVGLVDDAVESRRLPAMMYASVRAANEGALDEADRWEEFLREVRKSEATLALRVFQIAAGGMARSNVGRHAEAIALGEEACAMAEDGSSGLRGLTHYYLGEAVLAAGEDLGRAHDCLEQAIEHFRANAMHFWMGVAMVSLASLRARHGDPLEALPMFSELLDRWRRLGDWARQWVTLRNLAELLGRLELDEPATLLLTASVQSATAPPNIGLQAQRLTELQHVLADRMGEDAFTASSERARTMRDEDVVAYAKAEIDRALEGMGAEV